MSGPHPGPGTLSNPFPGLRPFRTEEYHLFFGREEQTAALLGRLEEERFLAVVGTSGSGKSSLVRAGLIPALHGGTMSRAGSSWEVVVFRPGGNPITSLARALLSADLYDAADPEALRSLRATLTRSLNGLVEAVRQSAALAPSTKLLVVVDQFEELFRFRQQGVESEEAANVFANLLLAAAGSEDRRIYIVITMRSDYLGECAQISGLAEAVNRGEYLIPRLSRDQRRDAIEKPVDVGGARIASRLVQHMLNDLGDEVDLLPVLQHALLRTWDAWVADHADGEPLDLRHYEATGGMKEALSRHADEIYLFLQRSSGTSGGGAPTSGSPLAADVCSRVFKALTVKGTDNRGIRRPTRLSRLAEITGASDEAVRSVIEAYRRPGVTFLMPGTGTELAPDTVIDLSHESLMRVWSRMRTWVEEEAQSARVYRRLAETAALEARREAGLYHDPDLQIALSWREECRPNEAWAEQYGGGFPAAMAFLDRSREAAEADERAREAARRRELEQARALAEAERRRAEERQGAARRMRLLAAGAAVVAAIAVVLYFVAVAARREAVENANLAREKERSATELAAQLKATAVASDYKIGAEKIEAGEGSAGLAHLARALRTDPGYAPAAMRSAAALASGMFSFETLGAIAQERVITSYDPNLKQDLVFTSDIESSRDTTIQRFVWDLRTGKKLYAVAEGLTGSIGEWWSPDGTRLLVLHGAMVRVLESRSGREVASISLPRNPTRFEVGRNPEQGNLVLFLYGDTSLQLWSTDTGEALTPSIARDAAETTGFFFSPDHRRFAIFYRDRVVSVHETSGGKKMAEIAAAPPGVTLDEVHFAPRGDFIVAQLEKRADWWPIPGPGDPGPSGGQANEGGGASSAPPLVFEGRRVGAWFLPSGDRVALQWDDPSTGHLRVAVHDLRTRERTALFDSAGPVAGVVHLDDDEAGRRLRFPLFGIAGGNWVRVWDLEAGTVLQEIVSGSIISQDAERWTNRDAVFSPDGRRIATVSIDHQVMLWDLFTRRRVFPRPIEHRGFVTLRFSPDGGKLVTHDAEKRVFQVWDARSGRRIAEPIPQVEVGGIHFTSRGERLVLEESMGTATTSGLSKNTLGNLRVIDLGMRPAIPEPLFDGSSHSSAVQFTPDGRKLVAGGILSAAEGYRLSIIDADSRRLLRSIPLPAGVGGVASTLRVTPDSRRVVLGCGDDPVRVWDLESGDLIHQLPPHEGAAQAVAISRDGAMLATASFRGKVRVFDLATGTLLYEPIDQGSLEIDKVEISPDGRLLASITYELKLHLVEARTGKALVDPVTLNGFPAGLAFSPDGSHLAVAPFAPEVLILDAGSAREVRRLALADHCRSLAFSPDGRILAVGEGVAHQDPVGDVSLWDWRAGRKIGQPLSAGGAVGYLAFSDDGALLATGTILNSGGAVQVWNVATGQPLLEPVKGRAIVETLSFRPGGTALAASWEDGTARTIDIPPGAGESPGWLPRLAEAVAGERLTASLGGSEPVPRAEIGALRAELAADKDGPPPSKEASGGGSHERWGRWLLADPESRPISPGSRMSFTEYLGRARRSGRLEVLEEALRLVPADGLAHGRVGIVLLEMLPVETDLSDAQRQHWRRTAAWYGQRAVDLSPEDPEAWAMKVKILQGLGREAEASAAIARALELDRARATSPSANVHLLEALRLAGAGKWPEADGELVTALEALGRAGSTEDGSKVAETEAAAPLLGALSSLTPFHPSASFREVRLPEPIPGTFEDFDSIAEGTLPLGWTASHDLDAPANSLGTIPATLGTTASEAFLDWLCISDARARAWSAQSDTSDFRSWMQRPVLLGRWNGVPVLETLAGGYLAAFVSNPGTYRIQSVVTRDFDCSGRKDVHAAFRSAYRQLPGGLAALEYSIDGGTSWLPGAYHLDFTEIVRDPAGAVDAVATLRKEREAVPRIFDGHRSSRGGSFAAFLGAPIGPDLAPFLVGRLDDFKEDSRQIEVHRLRHADGQPRVRLRFTLLGQRKAFWCIDQLGLYEGAEVAGGKEGELLSRAADPRVVARVGWELFVGSTPNPGEYRELGSQDLLRGPTAVPPATPGADAPPAAAGDPLAARLRALEARLLLRRASALAPDDPDILLAAAAAAARAGNGEEGLALARRALGRRSLEHSSARSLAAVFAARSDALGKSGDAPGASLALELAFILSQASGEAANGDLFARLATRGLLGERETLLPRSSIWRFFSRGSAPDSPWKTLEFDDVDWPSGPGRLGYGGDGEVTVLSYGGSTQSKFPAAYFRAAFQVADPGRFQHLRLRIVRDDGIVVYINGQEILRDNMPGGAIGYRTLASSTIDNEREYEVLELLVPSNSLRPGRNVVAAEVHQAVVTSSDLGFDLELEGVGRLLEPALDAPTLAALEEGLDLPPDLRAALWVSRAERHRLAGKIADAEEALRRASGFAAVVGAATAGSRPAIAYEEAMLQAARGDEESAYGTYLKAVEEGIALKTDGRGGTRLFLPRSFASPIEPLIVVSARGLAYGALQLGGVPGGAREREALWLLRRSAELDPSGPDALRARAEGYLRLARPREALENADRLVAAMAQQGSPATPRAIREGKEALQLRERCLDAPGQAEEALRVRETIYQAPPRPADLSPRLIDLSAHYNASLYDGRGWHSWAENSLAMLPETFAPGAGIRFDVRGLVQLDSGKYPGNSGDLNSQGYSYPDEVKGIRVGMEVNALHFLVSAINTSTSVCPAGTEVARLVIHAADGTSEDVPLRMREDVVDWALWREEKLDPARIAWRNLSVGRHLSIKTWRNPHPEKAIVSFDFISGKKPAGPFLVAVTAE